MHNEPYQSKDTAVQLIGSLIEDAKLCRELDAWDLASTQQCGELLSGELPTVHPTRNQPASVMSSHFVIFQRHGVVNYMHCME